MRNELCTFIGALMLLVCGRAQGAVLPSCEESDSIGLADVIVFGKGKSEQLREGAYTVTAIDAKDLQGGVANVADVLSRVSGLNIRTEGGLGADYSLSINGMSGQSVRYFVDGVPMQTKGNGVNLSNFPLSTIERIEVYKGVVPAYLGGDALGGAVNIVTKRQHRDFVDATLGAGAFSTYRADVNAQVALGESGLVVRPQFSYDYSKNDYRVHGIEVWNADDECYETVSRRRFHDRYRSAQGQVDMGVEHKRWTDYCFVGASFASTAKEIQTGTVQTKVVGQAEKKQEALGVHAKYRKTGFIAPDLTALLTLSHTWDHSTTIDTAFCRYDWNGDWKNTTKNELNGKARQLRHYKRPLTIGRMNLSYALADNHKLALNYMLTRTGNKRYDTAKDYYPLTEVQDLGEATNDVMEKHIIGLSYDQTLMEGRMMNSLFAKDYINHVDVEQSDFASLTNSDKVPGHMLKTYWGYGIGSRLMLAEWLSARLSYEHAVRLPQAKELLGNGTTVYANFALRPETSHNVNIGLFGNLLGKSGGMAMTAKRYSRLTYELSLFVRDTKDYIHMRVSEGDGTARYENVNDVLTKGVEAELKYSYSDWLQCSLNGTWQKSADMQRRLENGNVSATYKNRIPNRPWMFGNTELALTHRKLFGKADRVRFDAQYQYVHWYYLTWEAFGSKESKARIPTQNVVNTALTYSWLNERYSATFVCDNVLDKLCYDNYKLQKPGRAFNVRLRIQL